ncbi:flagellar basal body rod protein FlgC [bacterium]|nr:flagellar basal body rod protein FlgC [bacterium]
MPAGGIFRTLSISASGLSVQRTRLDVISENLANVQTTRTEDGSPYRRKSVVVKSVNNPGEASFSGIYSDLAAKFPGILSRGQFMSQVPEATVSEDKKTPFTLRYDPGHPDADSDGMVKMPNVNVIDEMVDMVTATRAYEANVTAIESAKDMFLSALEI